MAIQRSLSDHNASNNKDPGADRPFDLSSDHMNWGLRNIHEHSRDPMDPAAAVSVNCALCSCMHMADSSGPRFCVGVHNRGNHWYWFCVDRDRNMLFVGDTLGCRELLPRTVEFLRLLHPSRHDSRVHHLSVTVVDVQIQKERLCGVYALAFVYLIAAEGIRPENLSMARFDEGMLWRWFVEGVSEGALRRPPCSMSQLRAPPGTPKIRILSIPNVHAPPEVVAIADHLAPPSRRHLLSSISAQPVSRTVAPAVPESSNAGKSKGKGKGRAIRSSPPPAATQIAAPATRNTSDAAKGKDKGKGRAIWSDLEGDDFNDVHLATWAPVFDSRYVASLLKMPADLMDHLDGMRRSRMPARMSRGKPEIPPPE